MHACAVLSALSQVTCYASMFKMLLTEDTPPRCACRWTCLQNMQVQPLSPTEPEAKLRVHNSSLPDGVASDHHPQQQLQWYQIQLGV